MFDKEEFSTFVETKALQGMIESERKQIMDLIKKEVTPTIGCTEPIAIALCVTKAAETLGMKLEEIEVLLSANTLKDAMEVGIPGTDMVGLSIAVALGAPTGRSKYQLEVLRDCTPEAIEQGRLFIAEKRICISLREDIMEKLYIEVARTVGSQKVTAVTAGGYTTFAYIATDEKVPFDKQQTVSEEEEDALLELNLCEIYDSTLTSPLDEIRSILDVARLNKVATGQAFKGNYGYPLGKMPHGTYEHRVTGDSVFSHILFYTLAVCDARMVGAMTPAMSDSGNGDQDISATLPAVVFAEGNGKTEEELIRALILNHLTVTYIKQNLGRLFTSCGCVVTAMGPSCGITWLMGGNYNQIAFAVQNTIANLTEMICDGTKPSYAFRAVIGTSAAVLPAVMAMGDRCVTSVEDITSEDVDQSVRNLTRVGSQAMNGTDKMVLDIMMHKGGC